MSIDLKKINFKQPKYVLPAILYPLLLLVGYLVIDLFGVEIESVDNRLETKYDLNPKIPDAEIRGDGIGSKMNNLKRSWGSIRDYSAVENIDGNKDELELEQYDSKYSDDDVAMLEEAARQQQAELAKLAEMEEQLKKEDAGRPAVYNPDGTLNWDALEQAAAWDDEARQQEAIEALRAELARARLEAYSKIDEQMGMSDGAQRGDSILPPMDVTITESTQAVVELDESAAPEQVVKSGLQRNSYFNTIADNEPQSNLIKAIIDEDVTATDGSRVRIRLLDDVTISDRLVPKGTYLYAEMSGFSTQRIKGRVQSMLVDDDIFKISLSIYDMDGLEGLYVPKSDFMETTKDVAAQAMQGTNTFIGSGGSASSALTSWGMNALQSATSRAAQALGQNIRKNKAKLKYGTFVYLVNSNKKSQK